MMMMQEQLGGKISDDVSLQRLKARPDRQFVWFIRHSLLQYARSAIWHDS